MSGCGRHDLSRELNRASGSRPLASASAQHPLQLQFPPKHCWMAQFAPDLQSMTQPPPRHATLQVEPGSHVSLQPPAGHETVQLELL